jgi:hypothetical protein
MAEGDQTAGGGSDTGAGLVRRRFLGFLGATGVLLSGAEGAGTVGGRLFGGAGAAIPVETHWLRRRADLLRVRVDLWNLTLDGGGRVVPLGSGSCYLVFGFGPQNLQEGADKSLPPSPPAPGWAYTIMSGTSRIAFDMTGQPPLPFDTAHLLNWIPLRPSLPPSGRAGAPGAGLIRPADFQTWLEVPRTMVFAPLDTTSGWAHSATPVDHGTGNFELWHTRLATLASGGGGPYLDESGTPLVRSVWMNDPKFTGALPGSFPPSDFTDESLIPLVPALLPVIQAVERDAIVHLAGDPGLVTPPGQAPVWAPVKTHRLALTGLGAYLDLEGAWGVNDQSRMLNDIIGWRQVGALGRDHYVKVVKRGFLFPFGHRVVSATISERTFTSNGLTSPEACLSQYQVLTVRQPLKDYSAEPTMPAQGRGMPFRSIRILTTVSDPVAAQALDGFAYHGSYLPAISTSAPAPPYLFHFAGTDWAGNTVTFAAPVVFVSGDDARDPAAMKDLFALYNGATFDTWYKTAELTGQKVTVAASAAPGDTVLSIRTVLLGADAAAGDGGSLAPIDPANPDGTALSRYTDLQTAAFYPRLATATLDVPAGSALAGKAAPPSVLAYYGPYLAAGFDLGANPGAVFLSVPAAAAPQPLGFAADHSGGVATPNLATTGLSRTLGPISAKAADLQSGLFDPASFTPADVFADVGAKLLGGISLAEVLSSAFGYAQQAPTILRRELPDRVETTMTWAPVLKDSRTGILTATPGQTAALAVRATATVPLDPAKKPTSSVFGELSGVTVSLMGNRDPLLCFLSLDIRTLRFSSLDGGKPDVHADLGNVQFVGALHFVQELADACGLGGSGLRVIPAADRVRAELKVALPAITCGVLCLRNLAVIAGAELPYDGSPARVDFSFSSRADPFSLTVMGLGGGGFAGIKVGTDRVELLEFALEFGAEVSVDLGVASGSVEVKGGIYFQVATSPSSSDQQLTTTVYLRMHGELSVIGLIHATLEFYLALSYCSSPEQLVGECTLSVSVDIAFFSTTVSITVRRVLAKGGGGSAAAKAARVKQGTVKNALPRAASSGSAPPLSHFGDVYPAPADWSSYCAAFAPIGA